MKAKRSALWLATHIEFGLRFLLIAVKIARHGSMSVCVGTWAIKHNFSIRRRHLTRKKLSHRLGDCQVTTCSTVLPGRDFLLEKYASVAASKGKTLLMIVRIAPESTSPARSISC